MSSNSQIAPSHRQTGKSRTRDALFTEAGAWRDVGAGWQPLFGNFHGAGYSIEWHDFFARREWMVKMNRKAKLKPEQEEMLARYIATLRTPGPNTVK